MSKKLINILQLDEQGGAKPISPEQWTPGEQLAWVRLDLSAAKRFLDKLAFIPPFIVEMLAAKDTRPRAMIYNDTLISAFRGVNPNAQTCVSLDDMVSVRVFISQKTIITVQRRDLSSTNDIEKLLHQGLGPNSSADFLEDLLAAITDKTSEVVAAIDDEMDAIEDKIHDGETQSDRHQLNHLRRHIIILRRYLVPQREAILRIPVDKLSWLDATESMHLREIADAGTRIIEDLDAERERSTVLHEELLALTQEKMNQRMYLLALVAIIFMPLSFITGLLGVNVGGIPGASFKYGFALVCVLMLILLGLQLFYFRRKKWL